MYNPSTGFYSGVATQSLRFDDASSAYLQRTPSSAANRQTFTVSCWVKRSNIGLQGIFEANHSKDNQTALLFENSHQLLFTDRPSNNRNIDLRTNRLFRDVGAWYHIVVRVDTTQGTSSNRVRLYINGEQETSFATSSYPSQNYNVAFWNNTSSHRIGYQQGNVANHYDGYIAEFNNVGSSQAPTAFGETINDIWIPKQYSGSYGTNGFRLEFNGNGNDSSGNGNNFTTFNVSSHDYVPDCPENNFCTMHNEGKSDGVVHNVFATAIDGALRLSTGTNSEAYGTTSVRSGKWYFEVYKPEAGARTDGVGFADVNTLKEAIYRDNGQFRYDGSQSSYGASWQAGGEIIGVELDLDNTTISFRKNNTSQGNAKTNLPEGDWVPIIYCRANAGTSKLNINFGQDSSFSGGVTAQGNTDSNGQGDFYYTPPSGYLALCSANLTAAIDNDEDESAKDYFNTVLYTGTGGVRTVTGVGFQPDWGWFKSRSNGTSHEVHDIVRGAGKRLFPNSTDNESTVANGFVDFASDGYDLNGSGSGGDVNTSGRTYVAWSWKAGGSASSNTNGSITSSVSANQEAGFSILTYTGNATSGATIGHGLSQAPDMIITKFRQGGSPGSGWLWPVFHKNVGTGGYLRLNAGDGTTSNSQTVKAVGSSTYTIGNDGHINQSSGNFVAYCFHEVEGYSSIGTYKGNGSSANGTFIYTGFKPAFLILKGTNGGRSWFLYDRLRQNAYNPAKTDLVTDSSQSDGTPPWGSDVDLTSNGFKIRSGDGRTNGNGETYIYIAFAEQPFKYANAR
jgi:hypothetical protein